MGRAGPLNKNMGRAGPVPYFRLAEPRPGMKPIWTYQMWAGPVQSILHLYHTRPDLHSSSCSTFIATQSHVYGSPSARSRKCSWTSAAQGEVGSLNVGLGRERCNSLGNDIIITTAISQINDSIFK
ncbi:hypothetical protein TorRG33x02_076150 [Trema orientale]|uniref:Uncharacterized protein n=1 Tax=Trema orientale TaxID=63057 RepID=A0A2P5FFU3_TREOI|nr:hypothetical protein TorRG33x02_076150 [Trema orientale]